MSRGRCTAWAVAETFGSNCVFKIVLNAPGKLFEVTVAETAVSGAPLVGREIGLERLRGLVVVVRAEGELQLRRLKSLPQDHVVGHDILRVGCGRTLVVVDARVSIQGAHGGERGKVRGLLHLRLGNRQHPKVDRQRQKSNHDHDHDCQQSAG